MGLSLAKANSEMQLTLNGDVSYRTERYATKLSASSYISERSDVESTTRNTLASQTSRFLGRNWLLMGLINFEQNEELDLDRRISVGGAGGYFIIRSNRIVLAPFGGVVAASEKYGGEETASNNLEALTGVLFDMFQFENPEIDISSLGEIYLKLPDFDRVRINLEARLKVELVKDLFWALSVYDDYDNDTSTNGEAKNDFGLTTSIGWSFK